MQKPLEDEIKIEFENESEIEIISSEVTPEKAAEILANFEKRVEIINNRFQPPKELPEDLQKSYWPIVIRKSIPAEERVPKSDATFYEFLGITPIDLEVIVDHETFYDDVLERTQAWTKSKIPELVHNAFKKANNKSNLTVVRDFIRFSKNVSQEEDAFAEEDVAKKMLHMTEKQRISTLKRLSEKIESEKKSKGHNLKNI